MSYKTKEKSTAALVTTIIFVVIVAAAVAAAVFFGGKTGAYEEEYNWIESDSAAINGMLDGSWYSGEKNASGILSYKIADEIAVGKDGKGDFKIENSGCSKPSLERRAYSRQAGLVLAHTRRIRQRLRQNGGVKKATLTGRRAAKE